MPHSQQAVHRPRDLPIETLRAAAIIILVSFHVIGGAEGGRGLDLSYPHPLRIYADLLVDLRMPLFAFIAGVVYALRPVGADSLGRFQLGKLRRLALPGVTAITVFLLMAALAGSQDGINGPLWAAYLKNYGIFWFLQVMIVIFLIYGSLDVLSGGRVLVPALITSLAAIAFGWSLPSEIMSLNRLTGLLGYFLLGVAVMRHLPRIDAARGQVVALALVMMLAGLAMNLQELRATGSLSAERLDLQSLLFGAGACLAGFLLLPRLNWLQWLGAYSLTIYLYHILATSATRRVLTRLGEDSVWLHLGMGVLAGIALPVLLHRLALLSGPTRLFVLGLRNKAVPGRDRRAALPSAG